jgi:hypothetical protein
MSSPNKAAGTRWERDICAYLARWWPKIDRRILSGRFDKGDIINGPDGWTIEAKTAKRIDLPQFLREAEAEAKNAGNNWFVAVVKNRRGKLSSGATADAFAVMPLNKWAEFVAEYEGMASVLKVVAR